MKEFRYIAGKNIFYFQTSENMTFLTNLWWNYMPTETCCVKWPEDDDMAPSDPNIHYRPWLEQNIGKQGWDWDWRLHPDHLDIIQIKIRNKYKKMASWIELQWGHDG